MLLRKPRLSLRTAAIRDWADVKFIFENHILDLDRRELWRGSELIAVEPQVFDLLLYLVQNRERVVSKDDLIAAVWEGGSFPIRR